MSRDVQAWLDKRADAMATLLEALVRIPTENPPGRGKLGSGLYGLLPK